MSFLQQVQLQLATLPVVMSCRSDGTVVFVWLGGLPVYCLEDKGVSAFVLQDCITLYGTDSRKDPLEIEYRKAYDYKQIPMLLEWLKSLNLQNPFTGEW